MPAIKTEELADGNNAKLEHAVARLADLPTIPNTLLKIWQLVDSPDSSAADLERVIVMDQALSAKIIRLVNSPYHGLREPVSSCAQAVTLLGFKTLKNLCVCVSVVSACMPGRQKKGDLDLFSLWKHAIASGIAAQAIAARTGAVDSGDAFTAGILHDIGKFVLNLVMKDEYGRALEKAQESGVSIRDAEQDVIGADHCFAGLQLAARWGFPDTLAQALGHHHDAMPADGEMAMAEVVARANEIARFMKVGSSGDALRVTEVFPETWRRIGVDDGARHEFLQSLETRVSEARELMDLVG